MDVDGLKTWMSSHDMPQTLDRLSNKIAEQGMTVFARIDHAAAAAEAGLTLAPMQVLIFGNAHAGTPLMQTAPTIGIDLPLRMLVWNDEEGTTWLAYNDPGWIAARHGARTDNQRGLAAMRKTLAAIAEKVTGM